MPDSRPLARLELHSISAEIKQIKWHWRHFYATTGWKPSLLDFITFFDLPGYQLEKKTPGGDWEKVGDAPIFGESTKVDGLDPGQEYEFRVAAITDAGPGDQSLASAAVKAEKPKRNQRNVHHFEIMC